MGKLELFSQTLHDLDKLIKQKELETYVLRTQRTNGLTNEEIVLKCQTKTLKKVQRIIRNDFNCEKSRWGIENFETNFEANSNVAENLQKIYNLKIAEYNVYKANNPNKNLPSYGETITSVQAQYIESALKIAQNEKPQEPKEK